MAVRIFGSAALSSAPSLETNIPIWSQGAMSVGAAEVAVMSIRNPSMSDKRSGSFEVRSAAVCAPIR